MRLALGHYFLDRFVRFPKALIGLTLFFEAQFVGDPLCIFADCALTVCERFLLRPTAFKSTS